MELLVPNYDWRAASRARTKDALLTVRDQLAPTTCSSHALTLAYRRFSAACTSPSNQQLFRSVKRVSSTSISSRHEQSSQHSGGDRFSRTWMQQDNLMSPRPAGRTRQE